MRLALHLAVRLLRRRGTALLRTSALASLSAVVLGVAALVVVLALMNGYSGALRQGILSGSGHLVALFVQAPAPAETAATVERVRAVAGVERAGAATYLAGLLFPRGGGAAEAVTLKASEVPPPFLAGKLPDAGAGPLVIAVGAGLARHLAVAEGDVLSLQVAPSGSLPTSVPVRVGTVFTTHFAEIDERWVVARLDQARSRVPGLAANAVEAWVADPERAAEFEDLVDTAAGGRALVTTWQENNRNLFAALRWQKISLAVVLSLVLGVGAFEVASALVVLVTEKRRELGILLALGSRPALVRSILLLAGGALGVAGVLGGMLLGVLLVLALTALGLPRFPADIAAIYMVDRIPLVLSAADLVVVSLVGTAEVVLASLLPARRAAARDPVEVLRWV